MKRIERVDLNSIRKSLLLVENPARYAAAEFHYNRVRPKDTDILSCMCFSDLYEIGMANNAVRIIFDQINRIEGSFCDRAFSVAPDFEKVMREEGIPLFSIAENIPLRQFDMVGISVGYELAATNILQMLDLGGIPIESRDRREGDPIVIAGGPAATNPLPFGPFFDFIYIGESENGFDEIIEVMKRIPDRAGRVSALKELPFLWYEGRQSVAIRAIDNSFTEGDKRYRHYVVPSFKVVQDNGNVEIMRGCPNGCRFCHAGQYYKPYRQRSLDTVFSLVQQQVDDFGYREVTLASLSSGDYPHLDSLIAALNRSFSHRQVSFALPSLKVSSFSLDILEQISEVRKSGLTFAIETPLAFSQHAMNKSVPVEQVITIIKEAIGRGWRLAKFYFMVGLPFVDRQSEEQGIVDYLSAIWKATHINMNINIGTFIPKAHTPFQWAPQMRPEESREHLKSIKNRLKQEIRGIKVSYHEPSVSYLEGIISRGNADTARLIRRAYELGARLDAWDEHLKIELWQQAMDEMPQYDFTGPVFNGFEVGSPLPWDCVTMNVSRQYLIDEYEKASRGLLTDRCLPECNHRCGSCSKNAAVTEPDLLAQQEFINRIAGETPVAGQAGEPDVRQVIFVYKKSGKAVFLSHISTMRAFEQAFQRSGLKIGFTQGFNPKPRLEFLNPLTLGISGENELVLSEIDVSGLTPQDLIDRFNAQVCEGIEVHDCLILDSIGPNEKKYSLASRMVGSVLRFDEITDERVKKALEDFVSDGDIRIIYAGGGSYAVGIRGEKNLFKAVFPEMNKFEVIGSSSICRLTVDIDILSHVTPYDGILDRK
ncbi:MAG: DUF2344 domain-containing protein [Spirochaetales bacterium]|nr:DUF2344 domain-containing protein [Spirochaetales bacterium]